jgi:hypothetical protein
MNEEGNVELTVDGIDYEILDEGDNTFTIMSDSENFAEVRLSGCGEYYEYDYSPMFASFDDCSGTSLISNHDGIVEFFRWVIAANQ